MKSYELGQLIENKRREAEKVINCCKSMNGFYASCDTYFGQYWLRDMVYVIKPLLTRDYSIEVSNQLSLFANKQKKDGDIQERIINLEKMPRIIAKVIRNPPIIDYKYIFKGWVNWYAKTADTPLLMAIALKQYEPLIRRYINSDLINTTLNGIKQFLTTNTNTDHGFIIGGDWRDSMHNYENVELLSNQVLLFTAQKLLGEVEVANTLKDEINSVFWDNKLGYYQDYIGSETFDLLGHALALMTDIVHKENKDSILFALESASSEFGFRNISPPYSQNFCGRKPDSYQNGGVWPFVQGFVILALLEAGKFKEAETEFEKLTKQTGFGEWCEPESGISKGSPNQLFSAGMYLQCFDELKKNGN